MEIFLLKILYILLFCSIDVLAYFRVVKKIDGLNKFLLTVAFIWFIMLLLNLPWLHLHHLIPFKDFCRFSFMVLLQLLVYFWSFYSIRRIGRSEMREDLKQHAYKFAPFLFQKSVLVFFLIVHFLFIISWPG